MLTLDLTSKQINYVIGDGIFAPRVAFDVDNHHDQYIITSMDILGVDIYSNIMGEADLHIEHNQTVQFIDATHPSLPPNMNMILSHWKQLGESFWFWRYVNPDGYVRVEYANNSTEHNLQPLEEAIIVDGGLSKRTDTLNHKLIVSGRTDTTNLLLTAIPVTTANYEEADVTTAKDVIVTDFPANAFNDGDVYEIRFDSFIRANYSNLWLPFRIWLKINGMDVLNYFGLFENNWAKAYQTSYLGSRYSLKVQRVGNDLHLLSDDQMTMRAEDVGLERNARGREHHLLMSNVIWDSQITFQLTIQADDVADYDYMRFSNGIAFKSMVKDENGFLQREVNLEIE